MEDFLIKITLWKSYQTGVRLALDAVMLLIKQRVLIKQLLCTRHCFKYFVYIEPFTLLEQYCYLHFINEDTEVK